MKILLTGAHFTPAQAVIEELKKQGADILYIGRKYTREGDRTPSVESRVLQSLVVKFIPITAGRLQRRFTQYTIPSLLKVPVGFIQSLWILSQEKPDVVLSFGGYVAVPVVVSAWLLNIPVLVHEQTLVTGLANSISNFFADKIAVSFGRDYGFDRSKVVLTGNPMRRELIDHSRRLSPEMSDILKVSERTKLPTVLITGGNQGSHVINQAVLESLDELTNIACLIHQTGDSSFHDFETLVEKRKTLKHQERYLSVKWIEGSDLGQILPKVDLAVSRAGANTLLELSYFGVPALLIPIPFASRDEQNTNAKYFKKLGLSETLDQDNLTGKTLTSKVKEMLKDRHELKKQAEKVKSVVIPDAAKRLNQEILILASKSR